MRTHQEIEQLLACYRELDPALQREVDHHLRLCEACARQMRAYQQMNRQLARLMDSRVEQAKRSPGHAGHRRRLSQQLATRTSSLWEGLLPASIPLWVENGLRVATTALLILIGLAAVRSLPSPAEGDDRDAIAASTSEPAREDQAAGEERLQTYLYLISHGSVHRYNASTGEFVDVVVPPEDEGRSLNDLHIGPDGNLYVLDRETIKRYDGATNELIDTFIDVTQGGLSDPATFTFGPDGNIYISGSGKVARFDGQTGEYIDDFIPDMRYAGVSKLQFGPDGNLYILAESHPLRFDGETGEFIDYFIKEPVVESYHGVSFTFGPEGDIYSISRNQILHHDLASGALIDKGAQVRNWDLWFAVDMAFAPDGNLYISWHQSDQITRFNGETGEFIDIFISPEYPSESGRPRFIFHTAPAATPSTFPPPPAYPGPPTIPGYPAWEPQPAEPLPSPVMYPAPPTATSKPPTTATTAPPASETPRVTATQASPATATPPPATATSTPPATATGAAPATATPATSETPSPSATATRTDPTPTPPPD